MAASDEPAPADSTGSSDVAPTAVNVGTSPMTPALHTRAASATSPPVPWSTRLRRCWTPGGRTASSADPVPSFFGGFFLPGASMLPTARHTTPGSANRPGGGSDAGEVDAAGASDVGVAGCELPALDAAMPSPAHAEGTAPVPPFLLAQVGRFPHLPSPSLPFSPPITRRTCTRCSCQ